MRDVDLSDVLLIHSFGAPQWKDGVKKVRMIDDYRSAVSEATLRLQRRLREQGSCAGVRVALEELVGGRTRHWRRAVISDG